MTFRNLPNLYELRLDEDDETEYDYCDDSKSGKHFNGKDKKMVRSVSMENTYSDDDLEKGDAGSPPYFGQSCLVVRHGGGLERNEDPSKYPPPSIPSSPQPTSVDAKSPNLSPRKPVTIATSTLHVTPVPPTTLGQFKNWSVEAFEFAKQFVFEKIGKSQKTADHELERKVEMVRETQNQFRVLFDLARNLAHQYRQVVHTQKILSEVFVTLSHRNPEEGLCEQLNCNALTQRLLAKNGEALLGCLDVFLRSMSTLCNTTIEDTLATVKNLEKNRLKYDAYRSYVEKVRAAPRDHQYTLRLQEAERNFSKYQAKYSRLHHDLNIKLKFLEENKVKVCQKHLFLFHKGFLNYIAGNRQGIEDILHQFGGFPSSNSSSNPTTFLEAPLTHAARSAPNLTVQSHDDTSLLGHAPVERANHRGSVDCVAIEENVKTQNRVDSH